MIRAAFVVGVLFAFAGIVACGSSSSEDDDAKDSESVAPTVTVSPPTPEPTETVVRCEPGTSRPCKHYWTDDEGTLHCTADIEHCRSDGRGYLKCGASKQSDPSQTASFWSPFDASAD
jgi:hypothetical protein